jgi:hypothetical protein
VKLNRDFLKMPVCRMPDSSFAPNPQFSCKYIMSLHFQGVHLKKTVSISEKTCVPDLVNTFFQYLTKERINEKTNEARLQQEWQFFLTFFSDISIWDKMKINTRFLIMVVAVLLHIDAYTQELYRLPAGTTTRWLPARASSSCWELNPPTRLNDPAFPHGWTNFYRQDDISATAYFYLDKPANNLPFLAPANERTTGLERKN